MNHGKEPAPDFMTAPVAEGSLEAIQEGVRAEIAAQSALPGSPEHGLGVLQEYAVYRAAAAGVLAVLARQNVRGAGDLIAALAEAGKANEVSDLFNVAQREAAKEDFEHSGKDEPATRDERLVAIANAAAATAHAIAAVELGHESADWGIDRAHRELDRPGAVREIGTVTEHTLNTLLDGVQAA